MSFSDAGFGSDTPKQILANLKKGYGEPKIEEIGAQMQRLLEPFDRNKTIEELIYEIDAAHSFPFGGPFTLHFFVVMGK